MAAILSTYPYTAIKVIEVILLADHSAREMNHIIRPYNFVV